MHLPPSRSAWPALEGRCILDDLEYRALRALAERPLWRLPDVPLIVDIDVLRSLDTAGWIEARVVIMQNMKRFPGDPAPHAESPREWCSPIRNPTRMGTWETISRGNHIVEIRANDAGLGALSKARRSRATDAGREWLADHPYVDGSATAAEPARATIDSTRPGKERKKRDKAWLGRAIMLIRDHPHRTNASIAKEVGVDPSTLSRESTYRRAAAIARGSRDAPSEADHHAVDLNRRASRQTEDEEDIDNRLDLEINERNAQRNARRR